MGRIALRAREGWSSRIVAGPVASGRRFAQRGTNYARLVAWLLRRSFRGHNLKLAVILCLSLLYLAGQAAAIVVLYWYARQMQTDGVLSVLQLGSLRVRDEPLFLWTVVGVSAICFIVSAGCLFLSRSMVIRLVELDYAGSLRELIGLARRLPDPRAPIASRIIASGGFKELHAGCRFAALTALNFCNALPPLVGGAGAAVVLVWIDRSLTGLILITAVLWATLLYPLTLRAVRLAQKRDKARAAFAAESRELLRVGSAARISDKLEGITALADAYLGRRRVMNEMALLVQIGATIIVACAALYLAHQVILGSSDWPLFIAYLGGLRMALSGCFQAATTFGGVSRFYPQVVQFALFMQSAFQIERQGLGRVGRGATIVLGALPDGTPVSVTCGDRLAVVPLLTEAELKLALLQARAVDTGRPLLTTWLDADRLPLSGQVGNLPLAAVRADTLRSLGEAEAGALLETLNDSVTLVVHRNADHVGTFGDTHLIVVEAATIAEWMPLGTEESRAALEAVFAPGPCGPRVEPANGVDDEEDEDFDG